MASLLALPDELLQHIASSLPFSAVLQLKCANRRLHSVCNDRVVLRNIARNGLYNTSGAVEHLLRVFLSPGRVNLSAKQLDWREGDSFLDHASADKATKVAYAVERCCGAMFAESADWTLRTWHRVAKLDITEWLPQMLALHHPATLALEPRSFLRLQIEVCTDSIVRAVQWTTEMLLSEHSSQLHKREQADFINANFILTYVTLHHMSTTSNPLEILESQNEFLGLALPRKIPRIIEDTTQSSQRRVPRYGENAYRFGLAAASAATVAVLMQLVEQFLSLDSPSDLPKPCKMPFNEFMDITSVCEDSAVPFATCHLRAMTTPGFLSGRWRGYYHDQRDPGRQPNRRNYLPPMRDVRIVASAAEGHLATAVDASASIDSSSGGVDVHGHFSLQGQVLKDGSVCMVKSYLANGSMWRWDGHVTPFGIFGSWGRGSMRRGYLWLWKEEWC